MKNKAHISHSQKKTPPTKSDAFYFFPLYMIYPFKVTINILQSHQVTNILYTPMVIV